MSHHVVTLPGDGIGPEILASAVEVLDAVYYVHFRCNGRRLVDHPNLWAYARELYQQPGVAETTDMAQIKRHYYTTHDMLNPKRIIPAGPLDMDWTAPHGRG